MDALQGSLCPFIESPVAFGSVQGVIQCSYGKNKIGNLDLKNFFLP
uniref:Uncharacterized protein n=1 Tax=Rhizophora mucronata TaxID=61149 RepID=A0A2P2PT23_RHIMU